MRIYQLPIMLEAWLFALHYKIKANSFASTGWILAIRHGGFWLFTGAVLLI